MPFLLGETAFSAETDEFDPLDYFTESDNQHLDGDHSHHEMPWMNGTEQQQSDYATLSMDAMRNYMGSGYSWWGFQDDRAANLLSGAAAYRENWWAPLKFGNPAGLNFSAPHAGAPWNVLNHWRDKQMVQTLENYTLPTAPSTLPTTPPSYFNWYSLIGNTVYSGTVVDDQTQEPIRDAIVETKWDYLSNDPLVGIESFWDRIPTGSDGSYTVKHPPVSPAGYSGPLQDPPASIRIKASGAHGSAFPGGLASVNPLQRNRMFFTSSVVNETVAIGEYRDHKAWSAIDMSGVTVMGNGTQGGQLDAHARLVIHLGQESHLAKGSEVHLWTENTFVECSNNAYHSMIPAAATTAEGHFGTDRQGNIELQFQRSVPSLTALPNPCTDFLYVRSSASTGVCTVLDATGKVVFQGILSSGTITIDMRPFAPGSYEVRVDGEGERYPSTIMITRIP